jgi:hypothetical protein
MQLLCRNHDFKPAQMGEIIYKMETIQKILGVDSWTSEDHGQMYTFKILLENGKNGEVNAKTKERYTEGQKIWVTDEVADTYGMKWKFSTKDPSRNSYSSNGQNTVKAEDPKKDLNITVSWAIGQVLKAQPSLLDDTEELLKRAAELMNLREHLKESHDNG